MGTKHCSKWLAHRNIFHVIYTCILNQNYNANYTIMLIITLLEVQGSH